MSSIQFTFSAYLCTTKIMQSFSFFNKPFFFRNYNQHCLSSLTTFELFLRCLSFTFRHFSAFSFCFVYILKTALHLLFLYKKIFPFLPDRSLLPPFLYNASNWGCMPLWIVSYFHAFLNPIINVPYLIRNTVLKYTCMMLLSFNYDFKIFALHEYFT